MSDKQLGMSDAKSFCEHPAVKAWNQIKSARVEPEGIIVLKETRKSHVYRLAGLGPKGSAVVAKRCVVETAAVERMIYEEILPNLPMPALRYEGCLDEPDGKFSWLFLEDAGLERYSPANAEHRAAAGRWLGHMHTETPNINSIAKLPDRGPAFYLAQLRSGCDMSRKLVNPALAVADRSVLATIRLMSNILESRWSQLESSCDLMPRTLVHGDFLGHNVGVRSGRDGLIVLPFDWEEAGRGVPAADLGQRLPRGFPNPDLTTYLSVVRGTWPDLTLVDVRRLAETGKVLRCLISINWALTCLDGKEVEKPMAKLRVYATEIASAMKAIGVLE